MISEYEIFFIKRYHKNIIKCNQNLYIYIIIKYFYVVGTYYRLLRQ